MPYRSRVVSAVWLIAALMLSQSAAAQALPSPPSAAAPIAVVYSNKSPSGWNDLPIGVYRPPNSTIVVSGFQKGVGILFGAAGVLIQSAANSETTKEKVGSADDVLQIDLGQQATDITGEALKSGKYGQTFTGSPDSDGPMITVTPYAVITFVNDDEVLTHVFLKASFKPGPAGGASWTTRYICCTHQPVSFKGDDGLTANGGQALKETLTHELQGAVELMLHDVAGGRARDEHSAVTLETYVPFLRRKWKLKAYKLSEDDNSIVVATKASNLLVYAGVQQIDKAAITPEPAAPGAK